MTTTAAQRSGTAVEVVLGVDTHLDFHVAVALDELGGRLGDLTVPTTAKRATTPSFHGPRDSVL